MKKMIVLLEVLCLSLFLLTGCGSKTDSTGATSGTTTGSQQETTGTTVSGGATTSGEGGSTTVGTSSAGGTTAPSVQVSAEEALKAYATYTIPFGKLAEVGGVRIDGRTVTEGTKVVFEWSASGFVIEGELEGNVTVTINSVPSAALRVWVDGNDMGVVAMKDGKRPYTLAEGLKKGKHTIRVAKITEGTSKVIVTDVSFTGKLSTPKTSNRRIEFFGDSITAGTDLFLNAVYPQKKQDGTKTYAALTAEALDADYHVVALGGWGCLGGVSGEWCNIPSLLTRASYINSNVSWDTSQWQPDVVVINLGTNDWSYLTANNKTNAEFEEAAKTYLKTIRSTYANAHVIWAYGMMGDPLEDSLLKVIDELRSEDANMHYVALPLSVRGGGMHPGYEDSEICSAILVEYIKEITGWE